MAYPNLTSVEYVDAIDEVVSEWNHTTLYNPIEDTEHETGDWLTYTVEPDDTGAYLHYIAYSDDAPAALVGSIMGGVNSALARQGLLINSVDYEHDRWHVIHGSWASRRLPEDEIERGRELKHQREA